MDIDQINAFVLHNWILFLALAVILALLARTWFGPGRLHGMSAMETVQMLNRDTARLLDIRTDKEFEQGYILGTKHIPLGLLESRVNELSEHKDSDWIIVCQNGMRSGQAGNILRKQGFSKLHALSGGIGAWQNANLPLETGKAKKGGKKNG